MKPYPFASLNHFTVPWIRAIATYLLKTVILDPASLVRVLPHLCPVRHDPPASLTCQGSSRGCCSSAGKFCARYVAASGMARLVFDRFRGRKPEWDYAAPAM